MAGRPRAPAPTSSTSAPGTPTSRCTSRARAPFLSAPSRAAPARSPRRAWSSSTDPARTRWPGGPATSSTRSAGATTACSTRGSPAGTPRATRSRAPLPRRLPGTEPMRSTAELARAVQAAFDYARAQPDVREVEVFASANGSLLARLNYTSHIPCNGVEEPKSVEAYGLGIQAVFDGPGGHRLGFGSEPSDLGLAGAERALAKARRAAVVDPEFVSLPRASAEPRTLFDYHDASLMAVSDDRLVGAGWTIVDGRVADFLGSSRAPPPGRGGG